MPSKRTKKMDDPWIFGQAVTDYLLDSLLPIPFPNVSGLQPYPSSVSPSNPIHCRQFDISFDLNTGAINYLLQMPNKLLWASSNKTIGLVRYRTYSSDEVTRWVKEYTRGGGDFDKQGMSSAKPINNTWLPQWVQGWVNITHDGECHFVHELVLPQMLVVDYGAPQVIFVTYKVLATEPVIELNVTYLSKTSTRLAEAMFLSFNPIVDDPHGWTMDVLGYPVSPYNVVINGTRHLHAVWEGVSYSSPNSIEAGRQLNIRSLDAPLVAPGDINHLLWYDGQSQPAVENGMHFNLFNNLWGTAFAQWSLLLGDESFRFKLEFGTK